LPKQDAYSDVFDDGGYGFAYFFENSRTATFLIHLGLIASIMFIILKLKPDFASRITQNPKLSNLRNKLFFGSTLRFLYFGYLELLIAVCIGLITMQWGTDLGWTVLYCNCFTIAICAILIGLPLFMLVFYCAKVDQLDDAVFRARYGTLYEGTKIEAGEDESEADCKRKRQRSILLPLFFVLRRVIFVAITIMLAEWPVFQIMG